jgi:flagellar biosynthesis/type III secretory pathway chaperone
VETADAAERDRRAVMGNPASEDMTEQMELFYELLKQEFAIYESILVLCRNEHELIHEGHDEKLRTSLLAKDEFLNRIIELEADLAPLKKKWQECKHAISPETRRKVEELIDKFKTIAEEVMNCQNENEAYLIEQNQRKAEALSLVRKGKQFAKTYSGYSDSEPHSKYMDKKR